MSADLIALAERMEKAEGPDRLLDIAILEAFGWRLKGGFWVGHYWQRRDERFYEPHIPKWSASLDAAMTLVPEGEFGFDLFVSKGYRASCFKPSGERINCRAATPALALTAAALRARAAMENDRG